MFSSLVFLFVFLPFVILIYYILPKHLRNLVLLLASLVFYAWGEPVYVFVMIFSICFNFACGLLIEKFQHNKNSKIVLIISLIINLGILGFFKYYGFLIDNLNFVFGINLPVKEYALPVGISFYTFQALSYVIDVYLGKVPVQKNIIAFGTYITMFFQLVAGPIVQYDDIRVQLTDRKESLYKFGEGAEVFIKGLAKKVLLANNIGLLWSSVKSTPICELTVLSSWLGILAFTFQIYFDFSGYSDMAIGLGKMFGFELVENFRYPYMSKSVTEFWRRWHISLGSWFREYVYIPLGGNRNGKLNQFRNLLVVWFATGLWHGANWNFIIWGLYFGVLLIIEKTFFDKRGKESSSGFGHLYTMLVVIVGWVIFEFEDLSHLASFLKVMFGFGKVPFLNRQGLYYLYTNIILFVICAICSTPLLSNMIKNLRKRRRSLFNAAMMTGYFLLILISTAYLVNETYNPFLYFRF